MGLYMGDPCNEHRVVYKQHLLEKNDFVHNCFDTSNITAIYQSSRDKTFIIVSGFGV
jgi:hypothetical protein